MSFASVGTLGHSQEKVSDTSIDLTAAPAAGNLAAIWVAMDNAGTADADTTQLSVTDDQGNEYVRVKERTETAGAANDGVVVAMFLAKIVAQPTTITATSSTARTAKAISGWEFSITSGSTFQIQATTQNNQNSADPAAVTLSSLPSREYLLLWGFGCENIVNIATHDADYTAIEDDGTTGSTADTNVHVDGAFRIATLTTDTVDATASAVSQHAQVYAAVYEITDDYRRISQVPVEVAVLLNPDAVFSQVAVEVIVGANVISEGATDTIATITDAIAISVSRTLADTLTTISDSLAISGGPEITDTLVTLSDSLTRRVSHGLADTAATVTDTVRLSVPRALSDALVSVSDSIQVTAVHPVLVTDTAVTVADTISLVVHRELEDTVATISDSFATIPISDTLVTMTDTLAPHTLRGLTDTATTVTDLLRKTLQREIVDTLVTLTETLTSNNRYAQRIILGGASGSVGGTTIGATSEPGETLWGTVAQTGYTLWYQWTAPATGKYRFAVRPDLVAYPLADPWMQVYRYDPGAVIPQLGFSVVLNDEATWTDVSQENDAVVNLYAQAGETFVIQVAAWNPRQSPFTLEWFEITLAPDYDDFPGRTLANFDIINGNLEWCTAEPGDPNSWLKDFFYFGDPMSTPNRSGIFKATAEVNGTMTVTFVETDTSYELNVFVFDGDGVTSIADLTEDKLVTYGYVFDGTFEVPVIGGRDYYIYVLSDRPWDSPDALFRMRVAWPSVTGGAANDDFENIVDLDDNLWHAATTANATDESFPGEETSAPAFMYDPSPRTVWFKASYGADTSQFHVESRFASQNLLYEWYGLRESDEYLRSLVDTICTVTDGGIVVDPRMHWEISDTLVTQSEAILLKVTRALNDTLTTMSDVVQKGPADKLVSMSDKVTSRVTRRMTDFLSFTSSHFITRQVARGRTVTDTLATVSDSLAILNLRRFDLTDTAVTPSDTLARAPMIYGRSIVATAVDMSDALTRIPPVTVTDTITTISDGLTPTITRGRALADRLVSPGDSITTNRVRLFDYAIDAFGSGTMFDSVQRQRLVTRPLTDTIATVSDSVT